MTITVDSPLLLPLNSVEGDGQNYFENGEHRMELATVAIHKSHAIFFYCPLAVNLCPRNCIMCLSGYAMCSCSKTIKNVRSLK